MNIIEKIKDFYYQQRDNFLQKELNMETDRQSKKKQRIHNAEKRELERLDTNLSNDAERFISLQEHRSSEKINLQNTSSLNWTDCILTLFIVAVVIIADFLLIMYTFDAFSKYAFFKYIGAIALICLEIKIILQYKNRLYKFAPVSIACFLFLITQYVSYENIYDDEPINENIDFLLKVFGFLLVTITFHIGLLLLNNSNSLANGLKFPFRILDRTIERFRRRKERKLRNIIARKANVYWNKEAFYQRKYENDQEQLSEPLYTSRFSTETVNIVNSILRGEELKLPDNSSDEQFPNSGNTPIDEPTAPIPDPMNNSQEANYVAPNENTDPNETDKLDLLQDFEELQPDLDTDELFLMNNHFSPLNLQ